jgi:hypothetical protein
MRLWLTACSMTRFHRGEVLLEPGQVLSLSFCPVRASALYMQPVCKVRYQYGYWKTPMGWFTN